MRERIFWTALTLIITSWVLNLTYAHSKQLAAPIFLDHYIDLTATDEDYILLELYYLANKNDTTPIISANLDDIMAYPLQDESDYDLFMNTSFQPNTRHDLQAFTHHALRNIQLQVPLYWLTETHQDGVLQFNEIDLYLQNKKGSTVPVGDIKIDTIHQTTDVFEFRSGSSGGSWDTTTYEIAEELEITDITIQHEAILQDYLTVKVEGTAPGERRSTTPEMPDWEVNATGGINIDEVELPYKLQKGDRFHVYTQIDPNFTGFIQSFVEFSGVTTTNETFTIKYSLTSQRPELKKNDVKELIQRKGKGGES